MKEKFLTDFVSITVLFVVIGLLTIIFNAIGVHVTFDRVLLVFILIFIVEIRRHQEHP